MPVFASVLLLEASVVEEEEAEGEEEEDDDEEEEDDDDEDELDKGEDCGNDPCAVFGVCVFRCGGRAVPFLADSRRRSNTSEGGRGCGEVRDSPELF